MNEMTSKFIAVVAPLAVWEHFRKQFNEVAYSHVQQQVTLYGGVILKLVRNPHTVAGYNWVGLIELDGADPALVEAVRPYVRG